MASKDNPIHFNISSSVVRQLGLELVTDEVTAIMELVKNAYDADASRVAIEINTVDVLSQPGLFYEYKSPGYIIIDDTGFGMDLADIVNGWLVISLSAKRSMKAKMVRTPKGRIPLGEKGLGRLSTQKLGDRIEMITGKVGEANNTHVAFSWNDFSDDMPITEIRPYVNEIPKNQKLGGTKIIISNLTSPQAWESKSLNRFRGQLSQLIFPIKEKRPFQVYLKVNNVNYDLDELSDNVRKTAISSFNFSYDGQKLKVEGRIKASRLSGATGNDIKEALEKLVNRDSGREFYQFLTDRKLNKQFALSGSKYIGEKGQLFSFERTIQIDDISGLLSDAGNIANGFADPGRFSGEIDEYFFSDDAALGSAFDSYSDLKTIVQNQAGVRIYRDGFGIKPYGIGNDDWLNLGGGQTSGPSFYGMRPKNVIGFVSISSEFNGVLKEKTDREGLMEDSFSLNFFALMARVTKEINTVLLKTRRSFNEFRSKRAEEIGGFKSIGDTFNVIQTAARSEDLLSKEASLLGEAIENLSAEIKNEKSNISNVPDSEGKRNLESIIEKVEKLLSEASSVLNTVNGNLSQTKALKDVVEYLRPKFDTLNRQVNDFSELASIGLVAEVLSHELSYIIRGIEHRLASVGSDLKTLDENKLKSFIDFMRVTVKSFKKQLSHLSPAMSYVRDTRKRVHLGKFVSGLVEYYAEQAGRDGIRVVANVKKDFEVTVSEGRLTQVVDNIFFNSLYWLSNFQANPKHSPEEPLIITLEIDAPFLRIYDSGMGVDPGIEDSIFQPFVTGKPESGRGLGLFICQQLLETEGCSISLSFTRNKFQRRYIFVTDLSNIQL